MGKGNRLKTLAKFILLGVLLFVGVLVALQAGYAYFHPTEVLQLMPFYPIMGFAGALFGFERWWSQEQGGVNPFHEDHRYS